MQDLIDAAGDPFSRYHFTPGHFTASAFVLSPERNRVLLLRHAKLGLWVQPGGHIEPNDDDVVVAAEREVAEETGLTDLELLSDGIFDLDVHDFPARPGGDPRHFHHDVRFLFRSRSGAAVVGAGASAIAWIPVGSAAGIAASRGRGDESVARALRKLRDF